MCKIISICIILAFLTIGVSGTIMPKKYYVIQFNNGEYSYRLTQGVLVYNSLMSFKSKEEAEKFIKLLKISKVPEVKIIKVFKKVK